MKFPLPQWSRTATEVWGLASLVNAPPAVYAALTKVVPVNKHNKKKSDNRRPGGSPNAGGPRHRSGDAAPRAQHREHGRGAPSGQVWLHGYHAVIAALANPERKVLRLLATQEAFDKLTQENVVPRATLARAHRVSRRELDTILGDEFAHQGLALQTEPIDQRIEDVMEIAGALESAVVVVLDQITDPHNVGAIIRSAAALGAVAVLSPTRHAPGEGGIVAKTASGALERVPYVQVINISRTLEMLKEKGFWVIGLAGDGDKTLSSVDLKGRIALVLGTEGEGLRRLVRETCDITARLPIAEGVESLNVSNAAAVALYERARQIGAA